MEQREEIRKLSTSGPGGTPEYTEIRLLIGDTRNKVHKLIIDGNNKVLGELENHMELLDMEYELLNESLDLGQDGIALCNAFIKEYGSDSQVDDLKERRE